MIRHTRLYAILEVEPDATTQQIRQAFRRLSLRWHPDKHPPEQKEMATEKFQEITKAYEILADEEKRQIYDQYGEAGLKGEVPIHDDSGYHYEHFEFRSPFDVFREFFRDDPMLASMFGHDPFLGSIFGDMPGMSRGSRFGGSMFDEYDPFARDPFIQDPFARHHAMLSSMMSTPFVTSHTSSMMIQDHPQHTESGRRHGRHGRHGRHERSGHSIPIHDDTSMSALQPTHTTSSSSSALQHASSNSGRIPIATQQSTNIINGQRTTVTKTTYNDGTETTTIIWPDGRQETTTGPASNHSTFSGFSSMGFPSMRLPSMFGWPF
jgi:curved DNA-binding protein CbpA